MLKFAGFRLYSIQKGSNFASEKGRKKNLKNLDMEAIIFLAPIALGIIVGIVWDIWACKKKYNNSKNF